MLKILEKVIIMDIYDEKGEKIGHKAEYVYKDLVTALDLIIGITIALLIGSVIYA